MIELYRMLHSLLSCAGGPSDEARCIALIARHAEPYADELWRDTMGNLVVHKKGYGRKIMLSASCDVPGFLVYRIDEKGFLHVLPLGNIHTGSLPGAHVRFPNGTSGVFCAVADDRAEHRKMKDMSIRYDLYIDIGASGKQEALQRVSLGDIGILSGNAHVLAGERILLPGAANLAGAAGLLIAMQEMRNPLNDVYCVFGTQGLLRERGVHIAERKISPSVNFNIGMKPDRPSVSRLGKGVLVGVCPDSGRYVNRIMQLATEKGVRCEQIAKTMPCEDGIPGTLRIHSTIPVRGMNTPAEIIDPRDVGAAAALMALAANTVWEDENDTKAV